MRRVNPDAREHGTRSRYGAGCRCEPCREANHRYSQERRLGIAHPRPKRTPEARFWEKVVRTDGCWEWGGSRDRRGYGRLNRGDNVPVLAPRFSWELHNGPIPDGLWVLHRCDNPPCVRPEHLFLGTHTDNMADMASKGRGRGAGKLGPERRAEMMARVFAGERAYLVAPEYGVSPSYIAHLKRRAA